METNVLSKSVLLPTRVVYTLDLEALIKEGGLLVDEADLEVLKKLEFPAYTHEGLVFEQKHFRILKFGDFFATLDEVLAALRSSNCVGIDLWYLLGLAAKHKKEVLMAQKLAALETVVPGLFDEVDPRVPTLIRTGDDLALKLISQDRGWDGTWSFGAAEWFQGY